MCAWRRRMRGEELAAHEAMRWRHEVAAWQCEVTAWRHGTAPTATLSATFSLVSVALSCFPSPAAGMGEEDEHDLGVALSIRCSTTFPDLMAWPPDRSHTLLGS
ncbi:hypothetical protein SEVIR_8G105000v4 [Setaria viridis]|uniref:Uncharacterized protein n=1 Tax=Setaria viridis TaxID=4556 RepID=A0A4U6TDZ6_SETVI|nr:hypothetical protein SEVIR_8G105000v2 [Setaria viridis]